VITSIHINTGAAFPAPPPLINSALSRNSTGGLFYGPFAGFTAFLIVAVLRLRGAAASPDPRKANTNSMRLCPILSDVVGLCPFQRKNLLDKSHEVWHD
jgi:hypothetical protein